jgi:hypothetical protein
MTPDRGTASGRLLRSRIEADEAELSRVLKDPESKDFKDLRDRAAYVYATGSFPTHLRTLMTSLLQKLSRYSRTPVSLDGNLGSMKLNEESIALLELENHPLVRKVKDYVSRGYRIEVAREMKARRPYSKILMVNGSGDRLTVQVDGSVKEGW